MAIPYLTAKLKSANIFVMSVWDQTAKLIPANISGYTVVLLFYGHIYYASLLIIIYRLYDQWRYICTDYL